MERVTKYLQYLLAVVVLFIIAESCKRVNETIDPEFEVNNIYDSIDYGLEPEKIPVDSNSFLGIHTYIFSPTCAVPACHDGSFEPDFRTVESAYSTLVYHEPLKNNLSNDFRYRVEPGKSNDSWLYERITTDDIVLGRMPLYDDALSAKELKLIKDWIDGGAKDIFNNSQVLPDKEPSFFGIVAYENDTTGNRLDTSRDNIVAPMKFPQNTTVDIWFGLFDTDSADNFVPGANFTYNRIKLSTKLFDFSGVVEQPLIVELPTQPFAGPIPFSSDTTQRAPYYHHFTINTANFNVGQTNYMRVYIQDPDHDEPTELPDNGSQFYLFTYFSFIVL